MRGVDSRGGGERRGGQLFRSTAMRGAADWCCGMRDTKGLREQDDGHACLHGPGRQEVHREAPAPCLLIPLVPQGLQFPKSTA